MKINPRSLMASSINSSNHGFNATPMALLPPIPLYRRILRTHRKHLPKQMRLLGDEYVKKEFRSHKNIENPIHIEWQMYAQKLEGNEWIGERMDPAKIEKMSAYIPYDQQLGQMYELMQAIRKKQDDDLNSEK